MQARPPFQPIPSAGQAVRVPLELSNVRSSALEDYVRARILQFIRALSLRLLSLSPAVTVDMLDAAVRDALNSIPAPDYGQVPVEALDLQLVFRHDCQSQGCLDESCALCQFNTERHCRLNFAAKYLVNDRLTARCGATIRIELLERGSGQAYEAELPDVVLELLVLDGNAYDQKFLGEMAAPTAAVAAAAAAAGAPPGRAWDMAELEECALFQNNRKTPLLVAGLPGAADANGRIRLPMARGRVLLPDLAITDSSEALLTGRKPPYRLLVRALHKDGRRLGIKPAISEGFVVATRRTRSANKVEIPSMDDPISKLEHMGRETIKKLQDLRAAASQVGVEMELGDLNSIEKVSQFKALALKAEQDANLKQKLMQVLKLPKEKWDEAREHSKRAVIADNRMRVWYQDPTTLDVGLLFPCHLGLVTLDQPLGLLMLHPDPGPPRFQVVPLPQLTPAQRDLVRRLQPRAAAAWWNQGHTGWSIFPVSSETFEGGALTQATGSDVSLSGAAAGTSNYHPAGTSHSGAYLPHPAAPSAAGAALGRETHTVSTGGDAGPLTGPPAATPPPLGGLLAGFPPPAATAAAGPSLQQLMLMGAQKETPMRAVGSYSSLAGSSGAAVPGGAAGGLPGPRQLLQPAAAMHGAASAAAARPGAGGGWDSLGVPVLPSPQQLDEMLANDTLSHAVVEAITRALHNNTCPPTLLVHLRNLLARQAGGLPVDSSAASIPAAAQLAARGGLLGPSGVVGGGITLMPHPPPHQQQLQWPGQGAGTQPQAGLPPGAAAPMTGSLSELLAAGSGALVSQQQAGKLTLQQLMLAEQQRLAAIQAGGTPLQCHHQQQLQQLQGLAASSSQGGGAMSATGGGGLGHMSPDQLLAAAATQQAPAAAAAAAAAPQFADTSKSLSGKKRHCLSSASLESPLPSMDAGATENGMAAAFAALTNPPAAAQQQAALGDAAGLSGAPNGRPGSSTMALASSSAAATAAAGGDRSGGRYAAPAAAPEGAVPSGPAAHNAGPEGAAAAEEPLDELNPFLAQLQKEARQQQQEQLQEATGATSGGLDPLLAGLPPGFSLDLAGLPLNLLPALHAGASMGAPPGRAIGTTGSALATAMCSPPGVLAPASTGLAGAAAFGGWGADILPPTSDTPLLSADLERFMSLDTSLPMFTSLTMADQLLSRLDLPATLAAGVAGGHSSSPVFTPSSAAVLEAALGQLPMMTLPSIQFGRLMSLEMLGSWPAELSVTGNHPQPPHSLPGPPPGTQQQQQQQQRSPAASPPVPSGLAPTTSGLDTMQSMAEVLEQLESPSGAAGNLPPPGRALD